MNVYEVITNRIIEQLENGTAPWQKPWTARGELGMPRNAVSKKPYRGINMWMLGAAGFADPRFVTFKQSRELGGSVRQGEHGLPVVFWKFGESETKTGEAREWAMCRYYTVFNITQCDGIQLPLPGTDTARPEVEPIEECERIVAQWSGCPEIKHGFEGAFYVPSLDYIKMPTKDSFRDSAEYYSTLFHEMTHSTGHSKRLARAGVTDMGRFGDVNYSKEELVAEMGAAFLCGFAGIENRTINNSASYIKGWLRKLKDDPKFVVSAASQAQKACDLILGHSIAAPVPADECETLPAPLVAAREVAQLSMF